MGCRPVDNPPEIYQYSISGIDDGLWNGDLFVSWSVKDLDGDLFDAGARVLLHQNLTEQSSFSIAGCDFVQKGENETFTCSWHVPEDLPIFDIKEKEIPEIGYAYIEDAETGEQILVNTSSKSFQNQYREIMEQKIVENQNNMKSK